MAIVYFTNNADSGDGSLRAAIANAEPGDVVAPDPSVFGAASEIVVTLASTIGRNSSFTLDSGGYALILDGQGACRCLSVNYNVTQTFIGVTFYRGYAPNNGGGCVSCVAKANLTFKRCVFAGGYNSGSYGGNLYLYKGGEVLLEDCVVTCGRSVSSNTGGGVRVGADVDSLTIRRCTIVGNVGASDLALGAETNVVVEQSIVGYSNKDSIATTRPSEVGFVAPPPNDLTAAEWSAELWRDWNLRLNFDSAFCRGAENPEGALDVLGNPRKEDGAVGAFEGAWLVARSGETKRLERDAVVDRIELEDDSRLILVGQDRRATATESASFGAASIVSETRGYVVYPASTDDSAARFENVARCRIGARATSFSAVAISPTTAKLTWTANDPNVGVLLERRDGTTWTTLQENATGNSLVVSSTPSGRTTYRAFDGVTFITDDAWTRAGVQFCALSVGICADRARQNWEVLAMIVSTTKDVMPGQGITVLARIYDAFDVDSALLNDGDNIESVTYSCYATNNGLFEESLVPIPGHEDVAAETTCVLEALQRSDAWTLDDRGYNFVLTPDVRTNQLFPKEGEYKIKVTIVPKLGNPIVFYTPISVAGR